MSKRYNIKWRPDDEKELRRVLKNYNAKIDRVSKANPGARYALPEKLALKDMKELIGTRQDFNRELNSLRRFSKRGSETLVDAPGNEYGVKITKFQKDDMLMRKRVINRRRNKNMREFQELPATSRGMLLDYTRGQVQMGQLDKMSLSPIKAFLPSQDHYDITKKHRALRNQSRDQYFDNGVNIMKENYLNKIKSVYGDELADVYKMVNDMDNNEFYKTMKSEQDPWDFFYPTEDNKESYKSSIIATWTPNKEPGG